MAPLRRRHLLRRCTAFALSGAVAAVLPAGAGVPLRDGAGIPMRWDLAVEQPNVRDGRITFYVDPLTAREEPPGADTERDAILQAAATWESAPGSGVAFLEEDFRPAYKRDGTDRVNYIAWKAFVLGPFTLSATYTTARNGVISDADVILNDTVDYVKWATTFPGLPGHADVESVAAHELGHVLGLDHSPVAAATMSWLLSTGTVSARTLAPDDVGAVLDAYPPVTEATVGSIIGTVRLGRRAAPRGIPVFALEARTGEAVGCCLTGEKGAFRIRGLPPGPYRVAATPLSSTLPYSRWWESSPAGILPAFHAEELADGTSRPRTVFVRAGFPETGVAVVVGKYGPRVSGEPDGGPAEAREIRPGDGVAGAFDAPLDEDWYRMRAEGANRMDVRVRSWGVGAAADPEVAVFAADGTTLLAHRIDVRPPVDDDAFHGPLGVDRDAVITGFLPPGPGDLFLRVRAQPQSDSGGPGSFYLLEVVPSAGVPDGSRTTAALSPASTRSSGGPPITLAATPRDGWGDPVGPGASVRALRSDGGDPLLLEDAGDGTYAATFPSPGTPGEVRFTLEVEAPAGSAAAAGAATLPVAGPADAARSSLEASPSRVEAGSKVPVVLRFTPRDGAGLPLGPGLAAGIVFEGAPAGSLGTVTDLGDGTYAADLLAPAFPSSARVSATVDGEPVGVSRLVGFGWELDRVAADLGAAVVEAQGKPGVSRQEIRLLGDAGQSLDGILADLAADDEPGAASSAARAVAALSRAAASPRLPGGASAAADVAEALRRRVHGIVDVVVFPVPDPRGQRLLGAAKAVLARGDAALLAGDPARAARSFAKALRKAVPLL